MDDLCIYYILVLILFQATELLRILIVSSILGYMLVSGRPEGAPRAACEDGTNIVPGHGGSPQTIPVPYSVNLSGFPDLRYIPGQMHNSKCYSI